MKLHLKAMAAVVLVAAIVALLACAWTGVISFHNGPRFETDSRPITELSPSSSGVYSTMHIKNEQGKIIRSEIIFQNKDTGIITYRPSGSREELTVHFKMGGIRKVEKYSQDGEHIISGHELRADRTLLWRAETFGQTVEKVSYYPDGQTLFSTSLYFLDKFVTDNRYYREDGTLWAHQTVVDGSALPYALDELYDTSGRIIYRASRDQYEIEVTHFRPDGGISFTQILAVYAVSKSCNYSNLRVYLMQVSAYAPDGVTKQRSWLMNNAGNRVYKIVDPAPDGTQVETLISANGQPVSAQRMAADGTFLHMLPPQIQGELQIPVEFRVSLPTPINPITEQHSNAHTKEDSNVPCLQ